MFLPSHCMAQARAVQVTRLNVRETARKYDALVAQRLAAPTLSTAAREIETFVRHHVHDVRSLFEGHQGPLIVRQAVASAGDVPLASRRDRRFDVYGRVLIQQPGAIVRIDSAASPDGSAAAGETVAAVESCASHAAVADNNDAVSVALGISPIASVHQQDVGEVTMDAEFNSTVEFPVAVVIGMERIVNAVTDEFAPSWESDLKLDSMDSAPASVATPVVAASPTPAQGSIAAAATEPAPAPVPAPVLFPVPFTVPAAALLLASAPALAPELPATLAEAPAPDSAQQECPKRVPAFVAFALLCLGFAMVLPTSAAKYASYVAIQGLVAVVTMSFGLFSEWMYWFVPVILWVAFSALRFVLKTTWWIGFMILLQLSTSVCHRARWSFARAGCAVGWFEHAKETKNVEASEPTSDSEAAFEVRYDIEKEPAYERECEESGIQPEPEPEQEPEQEPKHRYKYKLEGAYVFEHDYEYDDDHDPTPFDSTPAANVVPEVHVVATEMHSDALSPTSDHHEALGRICPTDTDGRSALEDMRDELAAVVADVSVIQVAVPVVTVSVATPVVTAVPVATVAPPPLVVPATSVLVAVSTDVEISAAMVADGVPPGQAAAVAPVSSVAPVASAGQEIPAAMWAGAVPLVQAEVDPRSFPDPVALVTCVAPATQAASKARASSRPSVAPVPARARRAVADAARPRRPVSHRLPYNRNVRSRYLNYESDSLAYERNLSGATVVRAAVAARPQS